MIDKLSEAEKKYEELSELLTKPEIISDAAEYRRLMKEYKSLTPIIGYFRKYKAAQADIESARELLSQKPDAEMKELCEDEIRKAEETRKNCEEEIKILLLPKDPDDDKNVIIEIRGGAGGDEAALFSSVLYRMYNMYAESKGWRTELINANETELGGFKEVSFSVAGDGAFSKLKYESGVHRVQRVPETETQGRIHTSTVTVAVLPEAEEVEVEINPADLEIEAHRASGAGGQHINKTDSAIRILHKPSGIVVECQDERSQYKNRDKAMKVLRSKLYELERKKQSDSIASKRKSQVGTGDRSERIRTYNYPQGRVTDHRIGLTVYELGAILDGKMDVLVDALTNYERAKMLEESTV